MECRICRNSFANQAYRAREMMFGYRDAFDYFECSQCGCVQILEVPADLSKYYPSDYYSFARFEARTVGFKERIAKRLAGPYATCGGGMLGRMIFRYYPEPQLRPLAPVGLSWKSRILDVGCGGGEFLQLLKDAGFKNVLGIDAYIEGNRQYANGLRILKRSLQEMSGEWDLIMFHHSFEHLPDPLETLQHSAAILSKKGCCLIRIPTVSSYAWRHYRACWVQLDAPRHLFLHSVSSMQLLAGDAGFAIKEVVYDSTEFQFWASEQYLHDIPLHAEQSYAHSPSTSMFLDADMKSFQKRADWLNAHSEGDQAAFYLVKVA
ncbi:MAG TPA: class I SAM-dependent methyltransferase [Candidatus Eisenbacteria bacterium]|nr:class I SAM-dependent methyltransferase [Candidatus Eisenbacteria bacterium]